MDIGGSFRHELTGSFSQGSDSNPTVAMVEASYKANNLHFRYVNCEVNPDQLEAAVAGARAMNWKGFNCSIPHKVEVIKFLDGLGESASLIGAVNCAVNRDGKLIGENTDGKGFLKSFLEITPATGKTIVLLGAGGAARAIAVELALAGAKKFYVVNRSRARGEELTALLNDKTSASAEFIEWNKTYSIPADSDVVINSTSMGMVNTEGKQDIDFDSIRSGMLAADVIVNPPQTYFLDEAGKRGATTLQGLGMVVNQAVIGIKFWTGVDVDAKDLNDELLRVLGLA
ncbi:MAG: shikimate dehydrogenase [Actinobacteria bacterium]|nr:shikimate dehydrogenase [Actinomycetota bacterium]